MTTLAAILTDYAQSQWAIPSTFGVKERTTGLSVHLRNAAG